MQLALSSKRDMSTHHAARDYGHFVGLGLHDRKQLMPARNESVNVNRRLPRMILI
jgi:hypothetical protein